MKIKYIILIIINIFRNRELLIIFEINKIYNIK